MFSVGQVIDSLIEHGRIVLEVAQTCIAVGTEQRANALAARLLTGAATVVMVDM